MANNPYRRESKTEKRIYQPGVGKHPSARKAKWVGKEVTVRWRAPSFDLYDFWVIPGTTQLEGVFTIKWWGFVEEMGVHVHGEDLKPLPKKTPPPCSPS